MVTVKFLPALISLMFDKSPIYLLISKGIFENYTNYLEILFMFPQAMTLLSAVMAMQCSKPAEINATSFITTIGLTISMTIFSLVS
jgi:hypothetical protein